MSSVITLACAFLVWPVPTACSRLEEAPPRRPDSVAVPSDGFGWPPDALLIDVPDVPPGECGGVLWLTEFLPDPKRVSDRAGEYVEIYNPGDAPVAINGWRLSDLRRDSHVIRADVPVLVPPGGVLVLWPERDARLTNAC